MTRQSLQPAALLLLATVVLLGLPAASAADYRPAARKLMAGTCSPAVAKFENTYSLDIVTQLQGLQLTPDQCCGACFDKGFAYWQMTEVLPKTGVVGGLVGGLLNGVGNVVNGLLGGQQQQSALVTTCSCLKTVLLTTDLLSSLGLVGSKIGETGRPIDSPLPLPDPVPSPTPVASPGSCTGTPSSSNQLSVSAVVALKGVGVSAQQCCGSCGQAGYPAWQLVQLLPGLGDTLGGLSLCGCVSQSSDLAVVDTSLLSNAGLASVKTGSTGVPAGSAPTGLLAGLPDLNSLLPSLTGILSGNTGSLPVVGGLLGGGSNPVGGLLGGGSNNPVGGLVNGVVMTVRNLLGVLGTDCSALPLGSITSTVENLLKSLLPGLNLPLGAVSTTCTKVPGTSGLLQLTQQIKTDSEQSAKDIASALTGALQNGQLTGLLGGLLGNGNTLLPVNNLLNKVTSLVPCVVGLDVQCVLNTVLSATDILNNIPLLNLNLNNGGTGGGLNLPIVGNLLGGGSGGGLLGGLLGNGGALNLLSGNGLLNLNGLLGGVLGGGNSGGLLGGLLGGGNGGLLGGVLGGGNGGLLGGLLGGGNGGLLGGLLGGGNGGLLGGLLGGGNGGLPILGGLNLNLLGGLLNGGSATGSGLGGLLGGVLGGGNGGGLLGGVLGGGNGGGLLGGLLGKNGLLSIVPNLVNGLGVKLGNGQTLPAGGVLNILSKDRKSSVTIMSAKKGKSVTIKANSPKTGPITIIATPAQATINGKKVKGMALKTIINKPGKLANQKGLFARAAKMAASGKNGAKKAVLTWGTI